MLSKYSGDCPSFDISSYKPPIERKSGIPLATETPAPVKKTI